MSKKILIRLGMIATVVAIAIGGTVAYFSDTEVSGNNISGAGTFDITEDGGLTQSYSFADMYPGKDPEEINFTLNNKGSLPMRVWMIIKNVSNEENGILDSEQDWYDANGGVKNDLDSAVVYALKVDGNLALEQEAGITVGQVKDSYVNLVDIKTINDGATLISDGILDSGGTIDIEQKFYLPPETDNWAQSDVMNIEIEILAQQIDAQEPIKQLSFQQDEYHSNYESDGIVGVLKYDSMASEFNYNFIAKGFTSGTEYNLLYYADGWPGNHPGYAIDYGNADSNGDLALSGSVDIGMNLPHIDDANHPYGAKIWCVPTSHYNRTSKEITKWSLPSESLLSNWPVLINYKKSATSTETVNFSSLGADPQFGPTYDYSNASLGFAYDTPTDDRLSGVVTATGLKSDMTYQVKFIGKPTCNYSGGNDDTNERIGYKGRWTVLGTACSGVGCNRTDAQYEANKALPDGDSAKECIAGYLVWDYITADSSGDITKTVETDNSYHVLWCSGGTCGQSNNNQLSVQSPYPTCVESDVNGQIERFSCGSLNLDERSYNLKMVLTEESFHKSSYGTWTDVMSTDVDFEIE